MNAFGQSRTADSTTLHGVAQQFEQFVAKQAEDGEFSGAILIAQGNDIILAKAYGYANQENQTLNTVDTRFNMGSMNKMFTGLAIAQLAEKGLLDYADSMAKHYPDYPNAEVAQQVTIHHLLTHTSGMGFYPFTHGKRTPEEIVPLFADDALSFDPGDEMQYSNAGYVVLGVIIERVSGQSYEEYVQTHILDPAGMTHTGFFALDENIENRAIGYTNGMESSDGSRQLNTDMLEIKGSPAGGAFSTVNDMLRFGQALLDGTLIGTEARDVLLTGKVSMGRGMSYAYGFGDHGRDGLRSIGHNGGAPGVGADFKVYPEKGWTTVVFTNFDPPAMRPLGRELSQQLRRVSK